MKVHPAADLFPIIGDAEMQALADDIRKSGLNEPLVTWNGYLIDGRNRLKACELAGAKPRFVEKRFGSEEEVVVYIFSANIHRRHLSTGQKAMIATELQSMLAEAAKKRQEEGQKSGGRGKQKLGPEIGAKFSRKGRVDLQLGKMADVAHSSIAQAIKVKKENPDLAGKVRKGEVRLNAAYRQVTGKANDPHCPHCGGLNVQRRGTLRKLASSFRRFQCQDCAGWFQQGEKQEHQVKEPAIDAGTLSPTAKERLEIAIRQEKRKLHAQYMEDVLREADERTRESVEHLLEKARKEERESFNTILAARKIVKQHRALLSKEDFKLIWTCLHPDRVTDAGLRAKYTKAFHIFAALEKLIGEGEPEFTSHVPDMPRDRAGWDELKRKVAEERRMKREAAKAKKNTIDRAVH